MDTNSQTLMVIMPVYNSEKTLRGAVDSILEQSYRNLRLVIVDDASTDKSFEIAKEYAKDVRVVLLRNKQNRGAYYSRNIGLDFIKQLNWGYFTTHDSDDISFMHRYLKIIRLLKNPRVVATRDIFERVDLRTGQSLGSHTTMAHAVFKRSVFEKLGYFENVRVGADWEYWHRMNVSNTGTRLKTSLVNEVVGKSYIHGNNLTVQIPLNSVHRKAYVQGTKKRTRKRSIEGKWYREFVPESEILERFT